MRAMRAMRAAGEIGLATQTRASGGSQIWLTSWPRAGLGYLAIFLALSWHWLAVADSSSAVGGNAADEPLIVWILGWVRTALLNHPGQLFDAPINYPARLQLAGSEHLLSSQLLFLPLQALVANHFLAANLTLFLTYPLAALAMQRLLLALGCAAFPSFVVGLAFALGPFQVPANLHLLQYLNLYLPALALGFVRLRQKPCAARALAVGGIALLGLLSSYYTALITAVGGGLWAVFEFVRPGPGRGRYAVLGALAVALAGAVFVALSVPYFVYQKGIEADAELLPGQPSPVFNAASAYVFQTQTGWMHVTGLALLGLVALVVGGGQARILAVSGLLVIDVASWLAGQGDLAGRVGSALGPGRFSVLSVPGLEFFRYPFRFAVLSGFGCALLAAAVIETLRQRVGGHAATATALVLGAVVLALRGPIMLESQPRRFVDGPAGLASRIAATTAARGQGPLLELPLTRMEEGRDAADGGLQVRSMLLGLEHGLPLLAGHTGYQPRHRGLLVRHLMTGQREALRQITDMTGLRWILLRPDSDWDGGRLDRRRAFMRDKDLTLRDSYQGWDLLEVGLRPRHERWIEAIRNGTDATTTLLGTPLVQIDQERGRGTLALHLPAVVQAGRPVEAIATVANRQGPAWPGVPRPGTAQHPQLVRLRAEWRWADLATAADAGYPGDEIQSLFLDWDVEPGQRHRFLGWLKAPLRPGRYWVEAELVQGNPVDGWHPIGVGRFRREVEVESWTGADRDGDGRVGGRGDRRSVSPIQERHAG